jgi:hypothetical protein
MATAGSAAGRRRRERHEFGLTKINAVEISFYR